MVGATRPRAAEHLVHQDEFHARAFGLVKPAAVAVKGLQKKVKYELHVGVHPRNRIQTCQLIWRQRKRQLLPNLPENSLQRRLARLNTTAEKASRRRSVPAPVLHQNAARRLV